MKKVSISLMAILAVVLSVGSAFTTVSPEWFELKEQYKAEIGSLPSVLEYTTHFEAGVPERPCEGTSDIVCAFQLDRSTGVFSDDELTETERQGLSEIVIDYKVD